jgi:predicted nucleic acid-binding protein
MYVALAEIVGAPLITLDRRLAAAPGPRCSIELLG